MFCAGGVKTFHMTESKQYTGLERLAADLRALGLAVSQNRPLAELGTFQLGGPCALLVEAPGPEDVLQAARATLAVGRKPLFIGGGSNLLFSDAGYDGVLIRHLSTTPRIRREEHVLEVDAGTVLDDLAAAAAGQGLAGLEALHGIPGTVGGAVAGNAGAWGRQIGDAVESARLLQPDGVVVDVAGDELDFGYRCSRLQRTGEHLLTCRLRVTPGDRDALLAERARILALRAEKHPDWRVDPCIGSIFRNLEPTSKAERRQAAGHLLEQVGAKEMSVGGARLFSKHANIIIKGPGCTAQDVCDLIARMRAAVEDRFGVVLRREVRYLGEFDNEPRQPGFH